MDSYHIKIQINNVIFGFRFDTPENNLLNFIILIVKKYIYNCRCKEIKPCFEVALLEIKKYYMIEQQLSNFNTRYVDRWHIISEKINVL